MAYTFFYISVIATWILFFIIIYFKQPSFRHIFIGITTICYSLVYDLTLGSRFGLYFYISPQDSTAYIIVAAIFLYPLLNIIYTLFLPSKLKAVLIYTGLWIAAMLFFEYSTLLTKTIVFTGWIPLPWSIITYIFTYTWIYIFYRYLEARDWKLEVGS